jgi:ribosome assembly protein YihI (activator of Der GTPase)
MFSLSLSANVTTPAAPLARKQTCTHSYEITKKKKKKKKCKYNMSGSDINGAAAAANSLSPI